MLQPGRLTCKIMILLLNQYSIIIWFRTKLLKLSTIYRVMGGRENLSCSLHNGDFFETDAQDAKASSRGYAIRSLAEITCKQFLIG